MAQAMRFLAAAAFAVGLIAGCSSKASDSGEKGPQMQGTFEADFGPNTDIDGQPAGQTMNSTWVFRSACKSKHCVAVAVVVPKKGEDPPQPTTRVFDYVDGKWIWVGFADLTCTLKDNEPVPTRTWKHWTLDPQSDGTLTGTTENWEQSERCNNVLRSPVKLTKTADASDVDVPDPSAQPALTTSPAAGLHGRYTRTGSNTVTGAPGRVENVTITTECVRTGERCASLIVYDKDPAKPNEPVGFNVFVFADGVWTRKYIALDQHCNPSGTATLTRNETFRLPDPAPNPIPRFEADHEYVYAGDCPATNRWKYIYERTGD
jgi:hypothetical protein